MKSQKDILPWLTTVPASDVNFRWNLKNANQSTLKKALKDEGLTKTAQRLIESQLKRLDKKNG